MAGERKGCDCGTQRVCVGTHICQLDTLDKISNVIATCTEQNEMLRLVLNKLQIKLGMFHGIIMLSSTDNQELVVETLQYNHEAIIDAKYRIGEGISGKVLSTGKAMMIPHILNEPRLKNRIIQRTLQPDQDISFICVPIVLGNETVGTISFDMYYDSEEALIENKRILTIISSMIANDIHKRRIIMAQKKELEEENKKLRDMLYTEFRPDNIIGNSNVMKGVFARIEQVASSPTTVLIRGESGTGKELVASAIHYNSGRANKPFLKVNCAALNENLLESELFGHEKGAFTGATTSRKGRLEEAHGGTLFLDEIGDFSPAIQVKLLRVIQEREFERIGSNKTVKVDVRIIAATNVDLEQSMKENKFRQDLYYRINVFPINLPQLKDRRDDILTLANFFVTKYAAKMSKEIKRISTSAINMLVAYHWPGNVRELENCIEYAVLLSYDSVINGRDLPPTLQMPGAKERRNTGSLKAQVEVLEKDLITESLKRCRGNVSAASRELGITGRMVRYKIERYDIDYRSMISRKKHT